MLSHRVEFHYFYSQIISQGVCVCVCVYIFFIHSSINRHFGCFNDLAIVNNVAIGDWASLVA